ncbi:hypothetical protein [Staphylococcus xylosus]
MLKKDIKMIEMEYMNVISILFVASLGIARGSFFMFASQSQANTSPLYISMHEVLPLTYWGIPFFIGGLCLFIAAMALPYRKVNKIYSVSLIIGGIISAVFFFTITLASMGDSLNWMSPLTYFITTMACGGYAYFGVLYYGKQ